MPSACMKPEKKASVEAEDPLKQAINVVEKKVRNLEKRKGKLDEYKAKVKGGAALNDDQRQAVGRYDSVLTNLEFAKELQKQFTEIQEKAEKLLKKKQRAEQKMSHFEEVNRMQEVLRLQSLLDNMGSEHARENFKTGKKGAVLLSEEKLSQLDELYKLISPTRDGETSYAEQLLAASEHIVNFLDGKDKEVAGTTYKDLKQLVSEINRCGYFERAHEAEEEPEQTESVDVENEQEDDEDEEAPVIDEPELSLGESAPVAQQVIAPAAAVQAPVAQQQQQVPQSINFTDESLPTQVQAPQAPMMASHENQGQYGATGEEESFFSTMDLSKPRAFNDIVSSVQGSFDFLQESVIESPDTSAASSAAHVVDPAVVAARPMSHGSATAQISAAQHPHPHHHQQQQSQQQDALAQSYAQNPTTYSTGATAVLHEQMAQLSTQAGAQDQSRIAADQGVTSQETSSLQDSLNASSQSFRDRLAVTSHTSQGSSQFSAAAPQSTYDAPPAQQQEQSWASAAEQSWGSSSAEHKSWVEQTSSPAAQNWAEQSSSHSTAHPPAAAWSSASNTQSLSSQLAGKPPAPIPMPNEAVPGQPLSSTAMTFSADTTQPDYSQVAADNQEKKSQLNPNANIFNMYGGGPAQGQDGGFSQHSGFDQRRPMSKDDKEDFHTQGYRGGQRDNRGGNQRGGGSGSSSARGSRGGNMYGYSRGGRGGYGSGNRGSGGGSYQNGSRGGRGGGMRGQRGGPRGGRGSNQGYGQRPSSGQ